MVLVTRQQQLFFAIEDTEGTAKSLTTSSDAILALELSSSITKDMVDRGAVSASLSRETDNVGRGGIEFTFGVDLRGGGDLTTAPVWGPLLRACGWKQHVSTRSEALVQYIASDSSGATCVAGEVLTFAGGSGATARCLQNSATTSATNVFITDISGTPSGAVSGSRSGTSAWTSDGAVTESGFKYTPDSTTAVRLDYASKTGVPAVGETYKGASSGAFGVLKAVGTTGATAEEAKFDMVPGTGNFSAAQRSSEWIIESVCRPRLSRHQAGPNSKPYHRASAERIVPARCRLSRQRATPA